MVNFRFHLVSLTAVFLALAAGITIGAGVVDRATVDQIERQLSDVARRREATNAENDRLKDDLGRWGRFGQEAGDQVVAGELTSVPVIVVATSGIDRGLVDGFRAALTSAGAAVDGTFWLTDRWALDDDDDTRTMSATLDVAPTTQPDDLRAAAIAAVSTAWAIGDSGPAVTALTTNGFIDFEPGAQEVVPLAELPRPGTLFVVVSGDDADVAPADLAIPLVTRMATSQVALLAAQPVRPPQPEPAPGTEEAQPEEEPAPEFVLALRDDGSIANLISTVDNVDDYRGRIAAVLALRDLRAGRRGHFGFGPDARLVPEPAKS